MKNTYKRSKGKTLILLIMSFGISTFYLIQAFLSGKIIDIPHGTHEGGVISVIGIIVILVVMFFLIFIAHLLINQNKKIQ